MNKDQIKLLRNYLQEIYLERSKDLPYHGWHHVSFVAKKAVDFAKSVNAEVLLVESAALVHDLNYIVKPNSQAEAAEDFRKEILLEVGYSQKEIDRIELIIQECRTTARDENISIESKALSDADTLFKALPVTPIYFAEKYTLENKIDIAQLAKKITTEQNALFQQGIYFYTDIAKSKYLPWAKSNLELWNQLVVALDDQDVRDLLETAKRLDIIK